MTLHHCSSLIIYFSPHSLSSEQRFKQRLWEESSICYAKYSRGKLQSCAHCKPQPLPVQVSMFASHVNLKCYIFDISGSAKRHCVHMAKKLNVNQKSIHMRKGSHH